MLFMEASVVESWKALTAQYRTVVPKLWIKKRFDTLAPFVFIAKLIVAEEPRISALTVDMIDDQSFQELRSVFFIDVASDDSISSAAGLMPSAVR